MTIRKTIALAALLALCAFPLLWAEEPSEASEAAGLRIGGAVSTDDRVSTDSSPQLTFQEYRLELSADARPTDNARFHGEAWVRSAGLSPTSTTSSSLFTVGGIAPVSLDLREAYFELNGFLFENVDLKVGRQRIAWGTADKLNVTDNVNALDLSDPWDFGRHLGSDGVQLSVYAGGVQITGLAVAQFTPAVLPTGLWATALMPSSVQVPGVTLSSVTTNAALPGPNIADTISAGLKVKGNLLGYDLSASYLYGRQSLPIVDYVAIDSYLNATVDLVYPREHIFGADMAGSIGGVGVWAEAAVFLPEKITYTQDLSGIGYPVTQSTALDNAAYVKYVVGADYTFPGDVYLNAQYLHGMFQEVGADNLEDYFSVNVEWRLFDQKLKISPLNVMVEIKDWTNIPNNYALLGAPSVSFQPMDNAEIVIGVHWIQATSSTAYGGMSGHNEVFAHARYSF